MSHLVRPLVLVRLRSLLTGLLISSVFSYLLVTIKSIQYFWDLPIIPNTPAPDTYIDHMHNNLSVFNNVEST